MASKKSGYKPAKTKTKAAKTKPVDVPMPIAAGLKATAEPEVEKPTVLFPTVAHSAPTIKAVPDKEPTFGILAEPKPVGEEAPKRKLRSSEVRFEKAAAELKRRQDTGAPKGEIRESQAAVANAQQRVYNEWQSDPWDRSA